MSHHRQSQKIRSSIKARGPPGPIHNIQQASQRPPTSAVGDGSEAMVRQTTSGGGSRSGSPTPRNSPKSTHQNIDEYQMQQYQVVTILSNFSLLSYSEEEIYNTSDTCVTIFCFP